jgi:hypothetical protein
MSTKKTENRVTAIDSGAAVNKGVALRESQKESKPQGLSRPSGVIVPPVDQAPATAQNQQNNQKK